MRICRVQHKYTFSSSRQNVLANKVFLVFVLVHATDMLFEVIQPWPNLASITAMFRGALIGALFDPDAMYTFLMPLEVVDCSETLPSCCSPTVLEIARVWLIMFEHMFSVDEE